jgi:hypothetical protein
MRRRWSISDRSRSCSAPRSMHVGAPNAGRAIRIPSASCISRALCLSVATTSSSDPDLSPLRRSGTEAAGARGSRPSRESVPTPIRKRRRPRAGDFKDHPADRLLAASGCQPARDLGPSARPNPGASARRPDRERAVRSEGSTWSYIQRSRTATTVRSGDASRESCFAVGFRTSLPQ